MQLTIVLVFALCTLGVQSGCYHHYGPGRGWRLSTDHRNYQCVRQERCFDNNYNLSRKQKRVTQLGRCSSSGHVVLGYICCRHISPPPSGSQNFPTRTPTRNPSSRPMIHNPTHISSQKPNRNQLPQPVRPSSTQISTQDPIRSSTLRPQSPNPSSISPSQNSICNCMPKKKCRDFQFTQVNCPNPTEICCRKLFQLLSTSSINQSSQPIPPRPSQPAPQIPTRNPTLRPTTQGPSQIFTLSPTSKTSPQTQQKIPSQISPSNRECTCTPFFRCFDEETSSNLNGAVDDRILSQESCPSPNEVCCHNLIQPSSTSSRNPSILSQTQPQGLPEGSPSTNDKCNCIPTRECFDEDSSSNPFGLLDNHNNNRPLRQESCPNTNHVCCHNLVQPLSTPTRNPSPQPQSPRPFQISTQRPTVGPSPRPQSPSPAQISSSPSSNCLCTPFYKCYDEETSSNLTGIVNDRSFSPVAEHRACSDPNEMCCHSLVKPMVKPTTDSSSKYCSGSCVPIHECSNLLNILNEAKRGKLDAIQELRNLVCSVTGDGLALVCCQQKYVVKPFGVIFPDI